MSRTLLATPALPGGGTGAPTSGAHKQFELWPDGNGALWLCVTAGTPGTWVNVGSAGLPLSGSGYTLSAQGVSTWNSDTGLYRDVAGVVEVDRVLKVGGSLSGMNSARFVGSLVGNSPAGGVFAYVAGDIATDSTGMIWVCIASGNPGQWVSIGGSVSRVTSYDMIQPSTSSSTVIEDLEVGTGFVYELLSDALLEIT